MKKKQKWFDSSIMREDESRTTENTKHFVLNNGTRKALFSPQNINYFDHTEKVWKPIDNSLKVIDDGYLANLGRYTAKLSKNTENETVEISDGSDLISWEYLGINKNVFASIGKSGSKTNTKRKSKLNVKSDIKDNMNLSHASRAIYADAEGNIDLDYSIEGNGVKENIVIKEKSDIYHYYFLLRVTGFEMKTVEDGKIVEFYKPITDEENTEDRTPEFIMPAPFMYDANGGRSDDVKYTIEKIEEGIYIFSVEADAEWINAQERVFPVCIDPQLLTVGRSHITVTHDDYQWCDCSCCSDCSCDESYWMHTSNPYYSYIYLYNDGAYKTTAKLHIKKTDIDDTRNRLISVELFFKKQSGNDGSQIKVGDTKCLLTTDMRVDITSAYKTPLGDFDIEMEMLSTGSCSFENAPELHIQYQPIAYDPIRKNLFVENGVSAEFDVLSGNATITFEDIADPTLGVAVSHVYKPNDSITEYGQNFRLNLNETLMKTNTTSIGTQYTYTDAHGDVHTFNEYFYHIGTNGEKVYITSNIDSIKADADGRLWLNDIEVFRELMTDRGLRASARLEGVNDAEWVEQRLDEEKQAEEQVKSYKNTICNFVSVNKSSGVIVNYLSETDLASPDDIETFLRKISSESLLLLTKEEAVSYRSALLQQDSLIASNEALELQKKSLKFDATNLEIDYKTLSNELENVNAEIDRLTRENDNESPDTKEIRDLEAQKEILKNQQDYIVRKINYFPLNYGGISKSDNDSGVLTDQYYNIDDQIRDLNEQGKIINQQLNLYRSKSDMYMEQFKSYYKEYLNLKNQLEKLKMQVPVAYLISDSTVKGFNIKGQLVIVQDKYGKYVVVEHETYNTADNTRISAIYDQDSNAMTFAYNGNNKLSEICNSLGERVSFGYDELGYLTSIKRDNQSTLTLTYKTSAGIERIFKIESSNQTFAELSYNLMGMLTKITRNSTVSGITHDSVTTGSTVTLSTMGMEYTSADTKLKYDNIKQEIYTVDQTTDQITAHYELVNEKVTGAERYTYSGYLLTKTEHADKSCLNRYSYAGFVSRMAVGTVENVTYNTFKEPVWVESTKYKGADLNCPIEQTKVEYTYNDNHKLTEKKTTHCYCDCCEAYDMTVAVEKYFYNPAGELVRKESYVEGEELKTGINIEEHVFNDKGIEIQSFTYNSLDPSSKFYTENEVDEKGRTLAAFDESGEHKTTFDYERDGVTVKTERLPNGSKFSYGRDKDGTVTAITHSTENGEENSTTQTRTLDVVTEVKSGNNTVQYTYDNKRRVKSVSLNGTDNYVQYEYKNENTDAEKTIATMVDITEVTTIKNAHGNVTESSVGNRKVIYHYNNDQLPDVITEKIGNSTTSTTEIGYYDNGNVEFVKVNDIETERYTYDDKKVLTSKTVNGTAYTFTHKFTADKALDSIGVENMIEENVDGVVRPNTDALGRNTGKTIGKQYYVNGEFHEDTIAEEKISYVKFGDHATNLPSTVRFASNGVFKESMQYKYDSMGNIVEILENGRSACRYEYDALGRLTREDNVAFGKTTTWAYDNNGNIIAKYEYAITTKPTAELHLLNCTTFTYCYAENSDQLLSITKDDGSTVTTELFEYDAIGNPETYRGTSATWQYGRQLATYKDSTYTYDARGRRISKKYTENGKEVEITFTYDSNGNLIKQSNGLEFLYDHTGVFAVKHGEETYFYRKDAQGNVVALLDNNGDSVVQYRYDAWGKCKVLNANGTEITDTNNISILNPFRYRSYYYDTETGFYFLKTRYYDPEIARFITIDDLSYLDPDSINGLNLYAYCRNKPVMGYDPNGTWDWGTFWKKTFGVVMGIGLLAITVAGVILSGGTLLVPILVGAGLGMAANVIGQGVGNLMSGKNFFDNFSFSSLIMAGLAGAAFATGLGGFFGAVAIGAMANSGTAALQDKSWTQIGLSAIAGGVSAGIGYGVGRLISHKLFGSNDLSFTDFYQMTRLDAGLITSVGTALRASWYTFLPNISTSVTRGLSKYLGNKGINML